MQKSSCLSRPPKVWCVGRASACWDLKKTMAHSPRSGGKSSSSCRNLWQSGITQLSKAIYHNFPRIEHFIFNPTFQRALKGKILFTFLGLYSFCFQEMPIGVLSFVETLTGTLRSLSVWFTRWFQRTPTKQLMCQGNFFHSGFLKYGLSWPKVTMSLNLRRASFTFSRLLT